MQALTTSVILWGGILVAIPTAMPEEPFTSKLPPNVGLAETVGWTGTLVAGGAVGGTAVAVAVAVAVGVAVGVFVGGKVAVGIGVLVAGAGSVGAGVAVGGTSITTGVHVAGIAAIASAVASAGTSVGADAAGVGTVSLWQATIMSNMPPSSQPNFNVNLLNLIFLHTKMNCGRIVCVSHRRGK